MVVSEVEVFPLYSIVYQIGCTISLVAAVTSVGSFGSWFTMLTHYFPTLAKPRRNFVVPGSTCHRFRFRLSFIVAFDGMDLFPSSSSSPLAFVFCCVGGDSKSDIFVVDIFSRTRSEILWVWCCIVDLLGE